MNVPSADCVTRDDVSPFAVPSIESVEYGRRAVGQLHNKLKGWEAKARAERRDDDAKRYRFAAFMLAHDLLGSDGGGCVITAYDQRWLKPEFREAMTQVRDQIAESQDDDNG